MDLSNDLISKFVKITSGNDKKETKEGTVYGTAVEYDGSMYVKIDGSDLLTPINTTATIKDGERVTIMIKDHNATITGNITSPSTNMTDVTSSIKTSISESEIKTGLLIADKADIKDLSATNAEIENLKVTNAEIENLVVENMKATNAEIEILHANYASIDTLVAGNLTADNFLSFHITADKVTMEDAFIEDVMIKNISAGKITAGSINTNFVNIQSDDGGLLINGSTQQFKDKDGNVRIQIGKDSTGDFTFALYGADGKGQLINQNGITASAIEDGLIVNDMVSEDAKISGGKLDINSLIVEINKDGSETIKSSRIYLDEEEQSLEVAFKELTSSVSEVVKDVTTLTETVTTNTVEVEICKEGISTLVAEDSVIKEQITELDGKIESSTTTLSSKYSSIEQSLEGFKTTVSQSYATKNELTGEIESVNNKTSSIEQSIEEFKTTVASTYSTKSELSTRASSIEQSLEGFKTTVSQSYATKNELTGEIESVEEYISEVEQTANKFSWIVKSGTSSTNMTLTDEFYSLVSENITLKADKINLHGYVSANENFKIDTNGNMTANNGTFSGNITGGSININDKFKVSSAGALTTNSTITANGGLYTYQDIRGLDDTENTGGLTLVSGTGNVAVRTEAVAHSVYIQPASGNAYVTYPSSSDKADLHVKNLFSEQTNGSYGNFGLAQLYNTNAYLEYMYGYGVVRVVDKNHLYLQTGGDTGGDTSAEIRCTRYKDAENYVNLRAHNVCAQNAVYANGVNVSSDIARKRDIELYSTDALHEVCTTPVYAYHLDTDKDEELKRIGIIMQEAPLDAIDLTGKGVDLYQMVTMLWRAVQQQQEIIKELKGE